jgi:biopolymer transport protein ExbD
MKRYSNRQLPLIAAEIQITPLLDLMLLLLLAVVVLVPVLRSQSTAVPDRSHGPTKSIESEAYPGRGGHHRPRADTGVEAACGGGA